MPETGKDREMSMNPRVELEEELRRDPHLLGCGREIQFVARKP
jgi:hypothetical protein